MNANRTANWMAIAAIVFGVVTVLTGGRALFGSLESRADFGNVVPFVLWFNFLAGFAYVVDGAGMWMRRRWSARLALAIAAATLLVFCAFGIHVAAGGAYEARTAWAMTLRSVVWILIALLALKAIKREDSAPTPQGSGH